MLVIPYKVKVTFLICRFLQRHRNWQIDRSIFLYINRLSVNIILIKIRRFKIRITINTKKKYFLFSISKLLFEICSQYSIKQKSKQVHRSDGPSMHISRVRPDLYGTLMGRCSRAGQTTGWIGKLILCKGILSTFFFNYISYQLYARREIKNTECNHPIHRIHIQLVFHGQTAGEIQGRADAALRHVCKWGVDNKLTFAPHKTMAMTLINKLKYD